MEETTEVTLTKSEFGEVVAALRSWGDMLGECLADPVLTSIEKEPFERESRTTENLIDFMQNIARDLGWTV